MNAFTVTPTELMAGAGGLVVLVWLWRASARRARAAAATARAGARLFSLAGRVLILAALIVGVQWVVISHGGNDIRLLLIVLGLPALFASYALTKALTITTLDAQHDRRGRGGRR